MKKKLLALLLLTPILSFAQFASEGFEGTWTTQTGTGSGGPAGWALVNVGDTAISWQQSDPNVSNQPAYQGSHAAFIDHETVDPGTTAEDWLITPAITAPANSQLHFFSRLTLSGDQGSTYKIMISDTNPGSVGNQTLTGNYYEIASWTELSLNPSQLEWTEKVVSIPASVPAGQQIHIAFVMTGNNQDRWLIDNVSVSQPCFAPSALYSANITSTSATLGWNSPGSAASWEVEVLPATAAPTGTGVVVTANPYIVSGLVPGNYKYYVRAICGDGTNSIWVGPVMFSTAACTPDSQCNYTFNLIDTGANGWNDNTMSVIQSNIVVATLQLQTGATATVNVPLCDNVPFKLFWNGGGTATGEVGVTVLNTYSQTIYTKAPGEGDPNSLLYEGMAQCNADGCYAPYNITASTQGGTTTVSWAGLPTGTFQYFITTPNEPAPTTATTPTGTANSNPFTVTTLLNNTDYVVYVREYCFGSIFSSWSQGYAFTTGTGYSLTGNVGVADSNGICVGTYYNIPGVEIQVTVNDTNTFSVYTNSEGGYFINSLPEGENTITVQPIAPNGFAPIAAVTQAVTFGEGSTTTDISFCLPPPANPINDVQVVLIPLSPAQPGFYPVYQLKVINNGNVPATGVPNLIFDDSRLDFVGADIAPIVTGDILAWSTSIPPFGTSTINVTFHLLEPPVNQSGDILEFTSTVTLSGEDDDVPANNTSVLNQEVVNSFDPNDITVHQGAFIYEDQTNDYLTYTIRFQNTGDIAATNIRLTNVLDEQLDWDTFEPLSSGHEYTVTRNEGNLEFKFANIMLPGESTNEAASHGYVTYKIKPKSTFALGDIAYATANIFFDFNPAIVTNTASTEVIAPTTGVAHNTLNTATLYPNPVKNILNVALQQGEVQNITILDINGRQCLTTNAATIDTQALKSGIYFVRITTNNGVEVKKIIKE